MNFPRTTGADPGWLPTGSFDLFAIVGHPVSQVQAPGIFNRFFAETGRDAVFVPFDVSPADVASYFDLMRATENFRGGFVTVPHKQAAATHVDELTSRGAALGVVNAVKRVDGRLIGDMTDGPAFLLAAEAHGFVAEGARVGLIGGGGAATAIIHAFAEAGVADLVLSVRDRARHDALRRIVAGVDRPPTLSFDLADLVGFDMVINATSVGMSGDEALPHPTETMDPATLVGEVVTEPRVTPWLEAALQRGCRVQYGVDMTRAQRQLVGPWWGLDVPPSPRDED